MRLIRLVISDVGLDKLYRVYSKSNLMIIVLRFTVSHLPPQMDTIHEVIVLVVSVTEH